jgi:iron complex outermembrane recepter protein
MAGFLGWACALGAALEILLKGDRGMSRNSLLRFAIAAALLPGAAFAQSAGGSTAPQATETEGGLQEVIVTAERREGSLQETPLAVTALSEEALENRQVTEARDLARYTPSLKMFNNITSPTNLSPSMRGSLTQDASLVVAESPFGIYVDDIYLARLNGNNVALADVERVEVLRGPQGTLYGRNTLVGAIKFVSRNPGDEQWFKATVGAGNFDQYVASFSLGTPIGESNWAASFSALINNKDGQFSNRNPTAAGETGLERNWATRAKLRYIGSDRFDLVFSVSHSDAKNDSAQLIPATTPTVPGNQQFTSDDLVPTFGTYVLNTPNVARSPAPITSQPEGNTEQTIASINASINLGFGTLRSITGYVKTKDFFSTDFSGNGLIGGANTASVDQFSEEIQLLGTALDDRLNYIAGVYLFREEGEQAFAWNGYAPFPPLNIFQPVPLSTSAIDITTKSFSIFTQVDYKFTDALKGSLGVRYTKDDKDFGFLFQSAFGGPQLSLPDSNTWSKTTPRAAIDWSLPTSGNVDSLLLYASASNAFKSGGYSAIAIYGAGDVLEYDPETNWTYELGAKTDLLGNRLRVNANYFYSEVEDIVLNQTLPGGRFPVDNAGDATIQGLELEITAVPVDSLTLFMNGAFLSGKYKNLEPSAAPALALQAFNVTASPPQIPDYTVTVGFDYSAPTRAGTVKVGADWFFQDDYITSATNDFKVKAYNVGNAFVGLELDDNWSLRAAVKNIGDNDVITTGSRGLLGGFIPLRPREYLFSVNYKM